VRGSCSFPEHQLSFDEAYYIEAKQLDQSDMIMGSPNEGGVPIDLVESEAHSEGASVHSKDDMLFTVDIEEERKGVL
jgi:hypothetical protein